MVNYAGTEYYYLRNGQNDVVKLIDNSGDTVVEYIYDSWGRVVTTSGTLATTLGLDQPFRYRGYVYDTETGLYYVSSRYYDPEIGRWINADCILDTSNIVGMNLFAYCNNNPVMLIDPLGLCAKAWAAGYYGPCPGQGLPGCMDNWPQFRDDPTIIAPIDPSVPPDHPDYTPPKKWDGKKKKNPNGSGNGWPAKDGGVWVPTPNMHGGEGWTVQYPGGDHSHAYPSGKVRNHFQREQPVGQSVIMIFVGAVATIGLLADDITGFGAADDPLLVGSTACFVGGINGVFGKQVCTECGAVKYGY